ncbi:MAG: molybdopterin-dependent oxidoreductase, partial [Myxococcales bacterium]|nr:molybdopterin-dependent oxidoreductase [Myxococcales bacterium]
MTDLNRREFVRGAIAAGGLLLHAAAGGVRPVRAASAEADDRDATPSALGTWLAIAPDGRVTIAVDKAEMGQGIHTALAMIVADELDLAWETVAVEMQVLEGPPRSMSTGASSSVRTSWEPLARAAATARAMLLGAAAEQWNVQAASCRTDAGSVLHDPTGQRASYGALAAAAAQRAIPGRVTLRSRQDRRLIGHSVPRVDVPAKVDGSAVYGIDVTLPGLCRAAVAMPPAGGGQLAHWEPDAARAEPGVIAAIELPNAAGGGVGIVAEHTWQASRGLARANVRWKSDAPEFSSAGYSERLLAALDREGLVVRERGPVDETFRRAKHHHRARYEVPFLAHATLEPPNCTAFVEEDRAEFWAPTQSAGRLRNRAADLLGLPETALRVHTTLLGGGFGRRYEMRSALQAAALSRAVGRPVQVLWSREDDLRHDYYRPAFAAELSAALGDTGFPVAWHHRIAGPWFEARDTPAWLQRVTFGLQAARGGPLAGDWLPDGLEYRFPRWMRRAASPLAVEGGWPVYETGAARLEWVLVEAPVPTGYWRSVAHSQNVFFAESFIDELATRAGADPVAYRRALLAEHPRGRAVLDRAAAAADWSRPVGAGRGRGVAVAQSFGTWVAQVVEVTRNGEDLHVDRVVCAVDCGDVVH